MFFTKFFWEFKFISLFQIRVHRPLLRPGRSCGDRWGGDGEEAAAGLVWLKKNLVNSGRFTKGLVKTWWPETVSRDPPTETLKKQCCDTYSKKKSWKKNTRENHCIAAVVEAQYFQFIFFPLSFLYQRTTPKMHGRLKVKTTAQQVIPLKTWSGNSKLNLNSVCRRPRGERRSRTRFSSTRMPWAPSWAWGGRRGRRGNCSRWPRGCSWGTQT